MNRSINKSIRVRCSSSHAFKVFTEKVDLWWPSGHRMGKAPAEMAMEGRVGGRFYTRGADGVERDMGQVLRWEPPERLTCSWFLGTSAELPTEVDVRFVAEGEHTLVEVVHREVHDMEGAWPTKVRIYTKSWETVLGALSEFLDAS